MISYTNTDGAGLTAMSSMKVTVTDDEDPTISCPANVTISSDTGLCTASSVNLGTPIFSDNCSGAIVSNDAPGIFSIGITNVTWTVMDGAGNSATCIQTVTVDDIITVSSVTVTPNTQQYSDMVTFSATLTQGQCSNTEQAAQKVSFYVGTQKVGTVNLAISGDALVGSLTAPLLELPTYPANGQMAPGVHTVEARFEGVLSNYTVTDPTTNITIIQEDVIVEYTGQALQATPSSNSSTATVVLSANIQDITVTDGVNDPNAGDIRNAMVKFVNRDNNNSDISGWIPVVNLVNAGDNKTGTVNYNWNVDINNLASESTTIGIIVDNGYYIRDNSRDNTVVTVYKPAGDFITGGGYILPDNSAGEYASDTGLKTNFGFNVKYNKKGNKLKGHMNIIFRRMENDGIHTYQIKGNAIQSLGVNISNEDSKTATFITKSNLKDITEPLNPISIGGNLILKIDMTDRGEPGEDDSIAINLTNNNNELLYSSNWSGIASKEMILDGGNLVVHSGFSLREVEVKESIEKESTEDIFNVSYWPNPSTSFFNLQFNTSNKAEIINIYVFDMIGRQVLYEQTLPNNRFEFGEKLAIGAYLVKIIQGDKSKQIRVIRQ